MYGQRNSFQYCMNVNSARIAAAGRTAGTATLHRMRGVEQPSTRAASISSSGTACSVYCRMRNTPNPLTRNGRMTLGRRPVTCSQPMSM
jgi:hypothetical protein